MATFDKGERVMTPDGPGTVAYQRLAPPDYRDAAAVSVILDSHRTQPHYLGTMYPADHVTPIAN